MKTKDVERIINGVAYCPVGAMFLEIEPNKRQRDHLMGKYRQYNGDFVRLWQVLDLNYRTAVAEWIDKNARAI